PEQFKAAIAKLQQAISQKASHWTQQLEQATEKLQQLTSLAEARIYQENLLATKLRYDRSAQEPAFTALTESLSQWLDFFTLLETTPGNTLEQCQAKLQKLDTWHQQQADLSPALQALYSSHGSDLQHDLDRFTAAQKAEALKWWQECQQNGKQLDSLQGSQRFKIARTLQKGVTEGWKKYQHLIPDQKTEVEEQYQRCSQILGEEQIEHIKHLFRQVPPADRPKLLKDLYAITKAETEVM
ncbi:MAG: hypothetical protein VKK80_15735, partial [Prochlorothrix sp.]|nr:hypothetical protein [Prochlorothrix sp.]